MAKRRDSAPEVIAYILLFGFQLVFQPSFAETAAPSIPSVSGVGKVGTPHSSLTVHNHDATPDPLELEALIHEAMTNSPEILMLQARTTAQRHRVPQAKSLPDPMFMFGYQNEGFRKATIGMEPNAMGMFGLSQLFPFWGKRGIKGKIALREAESTAATAESARLKVMSKVIDGYYDLFLVYKTIDILRARTDLFSQVEEAAAGRYASGMGSQQEVAMAQTEKYMLLEREEMQHQRLQVFEGMLNAAVGREVAASLGRPRERTLLPFSVTFDDALAMARFHSPELKAKGKMIEAAEARVDMAKREYYPDITLTGNYFPRTDGLLDMWNMTATVNLPIFFRTKQDQGILEAEAALSEARRDLKATDFMIASNVRENFSMVIASDRLMKLYTDALIPKTNQDVQLALSGYVTGKTEAITVITRLKGLLDAELLYWTQYAEREKAIGRLHAIMGVLFGATPDQGIRKDDGNERKGGQS